MRIFSDLCRAVFFGTVVAGFSVASVAAPALAADRVAQAETQYSDEQLQAFAKSVVEVQQVNQALAEQVDGATDPAEMEAVQQQAYSDMEGIIASNGLSVEEYNEMSAATQSDEEVRQKVTQYITEMDTGSGSM